MQKLLDKIFEFETLSREEAKELLVQITNGKANDAQIVAAISALKMRTISSSELNGLCDVKPAFSFSFLLLHYSQGKKCPLLCKKA